MKGGEIEGVAMEEEGAIAVEVVVVDMAEEEEEVEGIGAAAEADGRKTEAFMSFTAWRSACEIPSYDTRYRRRKNLLKELLGIMLVLL